MGDLLKPFIGYSDPTSLLQCIIPAKVLKMAFLNKIGNILKQGVGKNTNLELSTSNASLFQTIRSMSSSKLFVGGLSYGTDESSLKEAFAQYGEVIEARIILDRDTGRSRGFGFISFPSSEEATSAMQSMDGQDLHGRRIRVNYATEKRRDGFGGGYGGGGFNYGGGGGYAASNYGGGGGYNSPGGGGGGYNSPGGGGGGYNSPGGGGGFSGGYNSAGGGGYGSSSGDNYGGEGGNFAGAGGYPTNNYGGGGGGFSSGNSPAGGYGSYGGGASNYGNNNSSPIEGGNYGSTPNNNYSGQGSSFPGGYGGGNSGNDFVGSPSNDNGFANAGFGQEQLSADQGTQSINENFGKETSEGNYRDDDDDDDDQPKDYANTRG